VIFEEAEDPLPNASKPCGQQSRTFAGSLIDGEEDRTLRPLRVGMLREVERSGLHPLN